MELRRSAGKAYQAGVLGADLSARSLYARLMAVFRRSLRRESDGRGPSLKKIGLLRLPQWIAVDVEISQQRDGDRLAFIIGSVSVGRGLNSPAPKVGKA